jgi:hypothetical protein
MPTLFVLLILNYLDRNALASARVQGIEADLGMEGNQFNSAISLLFVGYIIGQLPSNIILNRSRPSIYLSCCVFVWVRFLPLFFSFLRSQTNSSLQGMVSLSTGFVKNYHQLLAVRILLGFTGPLSPFSSCQGNTDLSAASTRVALLPRCTIYSELVVYEAGARFQDCYCAFLSCLSSFNANTFVSLSSTAAPSSPAPSLASSLPVWKPA